MPDEQPDAQPQAPQDPFAAHHANCVQIIVMLHNYRAAGGGLIESAVMVAAQLAVLANGGEPGAQT